MALGADDMQSASLNDFFVLFIDLRLHFGNRSVPLFWRRGRRIEVAFAKNVTRHEVGVSAEQNIGTAARHICGDGYGALSSGLSHDLRFLLVVLSVQYD